MNIGPVPSLFPEYQDVETNSLKIGGDPAIKSVYDDNTRTQFHVTDNDPISLTRITIFPVEGPADEELS